MMIFLYIIYAQDFFSSQTFKTRIPKEASLFLSGVSLSSPVKSIDGIKYLSDYKKLYYLCFDTDEIAALQKRLGSESSVCEIHRLHIHPSYAPKGEYVIITLFLSKSHSYAETRKISFNPEYLLLQALSGDSAWKSRIKKSKLKIRVQKIKPKKQINIFFDKIKIFSFPSSSEIGGRKYIIHGSFYIHESVQSNRYHKIIFTNPSPDENNYYDKQFCELLIFYNRLRLNL